MKKIKIGFLPFYVKLYDDVGVDRKPLEKFYEEIAQRIEEEFGLEVIRGAVCRLKGDFSKTISEFENKEADVIVTLHLAYSPSLESADALCATKLPVVVLDTTESYEFSPSTDPNALMRNHGIHGVMDMCCLLERGNKKFSVVAGHINGDVLKRAFDLVRAAVASRALSGSRTGVIGGRFAGMGDFITEDDMLKSRFGIEVVRASDDELKTLVREVSEEEIKAEKRYYAENYRTRGAIDEKLLDVTATANVATRKWIERKRLDAFTMNFMDINSKNLSTVPFIECCEAMRRGIGYAGEGDILTASFAGAMEKAFDKTSFAEIFCPDWKGDRLFISHMGEMNYAVASEKPVMEQCEFIYSDAADCFKGYACFKGGNAIFCNVCRGANDEWKLILSEIEMQDVGNDSFSQAIRGWFKPKNASVSDFLEALSENGGTHHSFIVYDTSVKAMKYFGKLLDLKTVVI